MKRNLIRVSVVLALTFASVQIVNHFPNGVAAATPVVRAIDNEALGEQSVATQLLFLTTWGEMAGVRWAEEHSAELKAKGFKPRPTQAAIPAVPAQPAQPKLGIPAVPAVPAMSPVPVKQMPVGVDMTYMNTFAPMALVIPKGTTVTWINLDADAHTSTGKIVGGVSAWDSGDVVPGEVYSYKFDEAGQYTYVCKYHVQVGMVGTISVTP